MENIDKNRNIFFFDKLKKKKNKIIIGKKINKNIYELNNINTLYYFTFIRNAI